MANAWIIGRIGAGEGQLLRILDLTPGAKVRVLDARKDEVYQALYMDKLTLNNARYTPKYSLFNPTSKDTQFMISNIISEASYTIKIDDNSQKLVLLYIEKTGTFEYNLVISDYEGNIKRVYAKTALNTPSIIDNIINLNVKERNVPGARLYFSDGSVITLDRKDNRQGLFDIRIVGAYKEREDEFRARLNMAGGILNIISKDLPSGFKDYARWIEGKSDEPKEHVAIIKVLQRKRKVIPVGAYRLPEKYAFNWKNYTYGNKVGFKVKEGNAPTPGIVKYPALDNIIKLFMMLEPCTVPKGALILDIDNGVHVDTSSIYKIKYIEQGKNKECLLVELYNSVRYTIKLSEEKELLYKSVKLSIMRMTNDNLHTSLYRVATNSDEIDSLAVIKQAKTISMVVDNSCNFEDRVYEVAIDGIKFPSYILDEFKELLEARFILLGIEDIKEGVSRSWYYCPVEGALVAMNCIKGPIVSTGFSTEITGIHALYEWKDWLGKVEFRGLLKRLLG